MTPLPLFNLGSITIYKRKGKCWSFTFHVNGRSHQSSHFFSTAYEAEQHMRELVKSYNELYERFK